MNTKRKTYIYFINVFTILYSAVRNFFLWTINQVKRQSAKIRNRYTTIYNFTDSGFKNFGEKWSNANFLQQSRGTNLSKQRLYHQQILENNEDNYQKR